MEHTALQRAPDGARASETVRDGTETERALEARSERDGAGGRRGHQARRVVELATGRAERDACGGQGRRRGVRSHAWRDGRQPAGESRCVNR